MHSRRATQANMVREIDGPSKWAGEIIVIRVVLSTQVSLNVLVDALCQLLTQCDCERMFNEPHGKW